MTTDRENGRQHGTHDSLTSEEARAANSGADREALRTRLVKLAEEYDPAPEGTLLSPKEAIIDFLYDDEVLVALSAQCGEQTAHWKDRNATEYVEQTDTVPVPRDLLHCTLLLFRGALDCKDWIWSPDQWKAGDTWCKELQAMLATAKEGK